MNMRLQYKTTTKYLFFSLPFYLMLFACGLQITDVEYALREAGENRGELEAVLSHYAKLDDRQKLEAAQYLIRYMLTILLMIKALRTIITPLILSLLYQKTNLNKKNISNRFVLDLKVNINRNGI